MSARSAQAQPAGSGAGAGAAPTTAAADAATITLVSASKTRHTLTRAAAQQAGLIRNFIGASPSTAGGGGSSSSSSSPGGGAPGEGVVAPAQNVDFEMSNLDHATLDLVVRFLTHHLGNPMAAVEKPLPSDRLQDVVPDATDRALVEGLSVERLFQLVNAANFLDAPDLLDLACAKVATMIKDKSPDEMQAAFPLDQAEFTPAEEEAVNAAHPWLEQL